MSSLLIREGECPYCESGYRSSVFYAVGSPEITLNHNCDKLGKGFLYYLGKNHTEALASLTDLHNLAVGCFLAVQEEKHPYWKIDNPRGLGLLTADLSYPVGRKDYGKIRYHIQFSLDSAKHPKPFNIERLVAFLHNCAVGCTTSDRPMKYTIFVAVQRDGIRIGGYLRRRKGHSIAFSSKFVPFSRHGWWEYDTVRDTYLLPRFGHFVKDLEVARLSHINLLG